MIKSDAMCELVERGALDLILRVRARVEVREVQVERDIGDGAAFEPDRRGASDSGLASVVEVLPVDLGPAET